MSNKNVKKEYIILGVVIIALLLYLVLRNPDKVHYQLPELKPIDAGTLTKIEIIKTDHTLTLVKKEDRWLIEPKGYPTDETKIKEITDTVLNLTLTDLVSKAKNYTRYELDKEKAIHVKAFQGEQVVREFDIGKAAPTRNHTFVKLRDDDRVFHAAKSFRWNFDKKVGDLRDKVVMKLDKNEISEIEVDKEGQKHVFTKTAKPVETKAEEKKDEQPTPAEPQTETIWTKKDGKEGNKSQLDSILNQLSDLKCEEYIEDKGKGDFKEPIYTIKLKGKKDYILSIYEKFEKKEKEGDKGVEKYPVVSSENPYPFLLTKYTAEGLMKKPEDLMKK